MRVKIFAAFAVVFFIASQAFAGFGFFARGASRDDEAHFGDYLNGYVQKNHGSFSLSKGGENSKSGLAGGFGVFYEHPELFGLNDRSILGIETGYIMFMNRQGDYFLDDVPYYKFDIYLKSKGYEIPVFIYYKYKLNSKFALRGGIGFTYAKVNWKLEDNGYHYEDKSSDVIMPSAEAGIEWLFSKIVTLGLDFSYRTNGKMENPYVLPDASDAVIYRDLSGIGINLSLKFYVLQ